LPSLTQGRAALPSDQLRQAAEGFEAIMVRKLLATARAARLTEDTPLTGGGREQFEAMRDETFADITAKSGALGFARNIEASLAQYLPPRAFSGQMKSPDGSENAAIQETRAVDLAQPDREPLSCSGSRG
jgi:flagellar protein FlgJ